MGRRGWGCGKRHWVASKDVGLLICYIKVFPIRPTIIADKKLTREPSNIYSEYFSSECSSDLVLFSPNRIIDFAVINNPTASQRSRYTNTNISIRSKQPIQNPAFLRSLLLSTIVPIFHLDMNILMKYPTGYVTNRIDKIYTSEGVLDSKPVIFSEIVKKPKSITITHAANINDK